MIEMIEVRAESMGKVPGEFTGITYTNGRLKPFAAWMKGSIVSYWATRVNATAALQQARINADPVS
jgi:hypothetical protein